MGVCLACGAARRPVCGSREDSGTEWGGRRLDGVRGTAGEESVGKYYYQVQVTWGNESGEIQ